jgi:mannosylglycerate hydrolase
MRFHVPTMCATGRSHAEGQFAVTTRGTVSEGGWGEFPLPTFPASSFVSAGNAAVLLRHVTEYELVEGGTELALTVLRAIGSISVNLHPLRDEPAAQQIPVPGAQELGTEVVAEFGILPAPHGWREADAVRWAEHFRSPGLIASGTSAGAGVAPQAGIEVDERDIAVSAVRDCGAGIEVRLTALCDEGSTAEIRGSFTTVSTLDLLGREIGATAASGRFTTVLNPWEIRTLRLI